MLKPQGYAIIMDPDAPARECDTITCSHCQRIVFVGPKQDPSDLGGFCRLCFRHVCGPCADAMVCVPFERQLEIAERRDETRRSLGI